MDVTYGADYSAGELSPAELDRFTTYDLRFLLRYIGWPDNPKCISHYPGAYQKLADSGRMVLLVAEQGTDRPGGRARRRGRDGAAGAGRRRVGRLPGQPADLLLRRRLAVVNGIPVDTAMSYLDGAASVLGKHRIGAYGFRDFIQAAKAGGHAEWLWLCGSPPDVANWPRAGRTSTSGTAATSARAAWRPT